MVDTLFTIESLLSLQGGALASLLVPNVLGYVIGKKFNKYRKYISLLIAFSIAFFVAFLSKISWIGWVVAIFNGFLIFASAVGINQMTTSQKKEASVIKIHPTTGSHIKMKGKSKEMFRRESSQIFTKPKKEFFSNWF